MAVSCQNVRMGKLAVFLAGIATRLAIIYHIIVAMNRDEQR